ncbi:MAG TPA: tyrosine-type recombinase/integrase [Rhizomicrobium sp.]|nr:tyrosine-type recombinase/integrase [Rhizomicrobium sp.]
MAAAKITKRLVDSLPRKTHRYVLYDTEVKGFGVRVTPSGLATYIVEYRPDGGGRNVIKKRMSIGRVGEITPEQARDIARDRLGEVRHGNDPLADRQTKRRELNIIGLIEQWNEENPPGRRTGKPMEPRTKANTLARLRHHVVPILGRKRVSDVTVDDVNDFIRRVTKGETARSAVSAKKRGRIKVRGGQGAARKVAADLSLIFGYAIEKRIVSINPVAAARKPPPGKRYDFLSVEEFAAMGKALTELEAEGVNPTGINVLRLLLLTGARPSEIESLRWSEVDQQGRCLRLAHSKTGYSVRPLSPPALDLINAQPRRLKSPFVFPASRGEGHFIGSKKIWEQARERAGLPHRVRYHARHAIASIALSEGIDVASVAAMMGHKGPRTTLAIYAHVIDSRAAQAADSIGAKIAAALNGGSSKPRASGE